MGRKGGPYLRANHFVINAYRLLLLRAGAITAEEEAEEEAEWMENQITIRLGAVAGAATRKETNKQKINR